jgi:hypothetical protein
MKSITNFVIAGGFALGALGMSTAALATAFSISAVGIEDVGVAGLQTSETLSGSPPIPTSSFPTVGRSFSSDPDGGCDDDAFFNFSGLGNGLAGHTTCGDALIFAPSSAGGTVGNTNGNLTDSGFGNHHGIEFHVEDSAGSGSNVAGNIVATLTIGNSSGTLTIPFTINFTSTSDNFVIGAQSISVTTTGGTDAGTYHFITGGITLGTQAGGFSQGGNDEGAFEGDLWGCVSTSNSSSTRTACEAGGGTVSAFVANDPPPSADVPEPASMAIFGSALISLRLARRRRF